TYDATNRITSITDPIGRTVQYTYNGFGTLATVTGPEGGVTRYNYSNATLLTQVIDARGVTVATNTYDGHGRVIDQGQADGGHIQFQYTLVNPLVGTSPVIQTVVTDPLGRKTTYRYNPEGLLVGVTDPLGQSRVFDREIGSNLLIAVSGPGECDICH